MDLVNITSWSCISADLRRNRWLQGSRYVPARVLAALPVYLHDFTVSLGGPVATLKGNRMDILVNVVLPLSLAIIMVSLGIGLVPADFRRVAQRGYVFAIGALCQILLIPLVAYLVILAFGLTGVIAAGVMLLAFCPGGVTTNVISRLAGGDVALSVSLTAVVSLLSILTVPFLALAPALADRIEPKLLVLSSVLFALIVIAAVVSNWSLFTGNMGALGPAMVTLNIVTMMAGLFIAGLFGFAWRERKTISIEVGIQNGTLGITLAPIIAGTAGGIPAIGLPSAVYGIIMYITVVPYVLWLRSRSSGQ